jgi:hypothetical protein
MTEYKYLLTNRDGVEQLSVIFADGHPLTVESTHYRYPDLVAAVRAGRPGEEVQQMMTGRAVLHDIVRLSSRMELRDGKLYFDGERVRGRIAKHLRRMSGQHDPQLSALVEFLTKLKANPSVASQEALYRWLSDRDFTITRDGNIIAYKGLTATGLSIHSGHAWVNGVRVDGQIPNPVGAVITMPRDEVNPDRFASCSHGLHVGTWRYASSFGNGMTATVEVDPADVVMVPDESGWAKMRVCRYKVLSTAIEEYKLPVAHDPEAPHAPLPRESHADDEAE